MRYPSAFSSGSTIAWSEYTVQRRDQLSTKFRYRSQGKLVAIIILVSLSLASGEVSAAQPEYVEAETPAPASAKDIRGPLAGLFRPREQRTPLFPRLGDYVESLPAFWRDTTLTLRPRLYHFDRDRGETSDQRTTAAGAAIEYRSGQWQERLSVGLTGYTTQKIDGPRDAAGLGMLKPVQTGFGVLGEAYARVSVMPVAELRLYRQSMSLPYFNRNDSRMVPITHEAYLVGQPNPQKLQWVGAHVTKMKRRDSDRFVPLSEAAGFTGTDEGASLAGFRWHINEVTTLGAITYQAWDFMNITYSEFRTTLKVTEVIPLALSAQATYQVSIGDELGGDFGTYTMGGRAAFSYRNAVFSVAGTYTDEDAGIRSPFGGRPSYLSLMLADFDRAGEKAWLISASYNFERFKIDGLTVHAKYAQGYGNAGAPDQNELNMTVDFKPRQTLFGGIWLRLRYATLDVDDGTDRDDVRYIVNYEIPLL